MSISIIERILGANRFYMDSYIHNTILLTKSISLCSSIEATLYNDYVKITHPQHTLNLEDKTTWRYYKHLAKQYHSLDKPMTLISIDNGSSIHLTKESISLHKLTRVELSKFSLYYKELVNKYPDQELLIKSIISTSPSIPIEEITQLPDYSITTYNQDLIEANENDIIQELQTLINNYKVSNLLPYYSVSDDLFLASQYHILYTYILLTIITIRLQNAKTLKAHSFHILNYLSSHKYLDKYYQHLTKEQTLFLYRNLLYLNNHSGREDIFTLLIDRLFTDRDIPIVNYTFSQSNVLDDNNYMKYHFKQRLLNKENLVYSTHNFSLEEIQLKEVNLAQSNIDEKTHNTKYIDHEFKNTLFNSLITKNLETTVVDNTDVVRHRLIPTIVDYWAFLLKENRLNYLVSILNPAGNVEIKLHTSDLFKLFIVTLYKINNISLDVFPNYTIQRVYKPTLPSTDTLLSFFYDKELWHDEAIDNIIHSIPIYSTAVTSSQFQEFVSSIYKLNIGLWLFLTNLSDKNNNGQFEMLVDNLHTKDTYAIDNETPIDFLTRIGMSDITHFNLEALNALLFSILNNLYDNKLNFLNGQVYVQQAMVDIFKKFNSYTVQIINTYEFLSPMLVGPKSTRLSVEKDLHSKHYIYDAYTLNVDLIYIVKKTLQALYETRVDSNYSYSSKLKINASNSINIVSKNVVNVPIDFNTKLVNILGNNNWIASQSSEDTLFFLSFN